MPLLDAVRSLAEASSAEEASRAILRSLARTTPANALAVLRAGDDGSLFVAAQIGLSVAASSVRFRPADHPRLARAMASAAPIRFDDPRQPDPYDGLLLGSTAAVDPIHACLAAPIYARDRLIGVLTMDALDPRGLDGIRDDEVRLFAGLAAAAARLGPAPAPTSAAWRSREASPLLGRSFAMERIDREIAVLGPLPTTTLITGETGVGKELVARALHDRSPRASRPFLAVNCAALPRELVLSELFGHARGAFTGAAAPRAGRFEAADGGTLFLDEIGDLPLEAQAPLLRAIQDGEIQRVGEDRARHVDVRLVAATHRDLHHEVREGRFRADLLHRLWIYPIAVPPLRERAEDIPILAWHFAAAFAARLSLPEIHLDEELLSALTRLPWPGNVRQLEHAIERAAIHRLVAQGGSGQTPLLLRRADLDPALAGPAGSRVALGDSLDRARREAFVHAFQASSGNAAGAARLLGLSRSFTYKEATRLGILPRAGKR
ncbi:MAG: sigma 54-interacting transcriptional regulator [Byssovorax sp.]